MNQNFQFHHSKPNFWTGENWNYSNWISTTSWGKNILKKILWRYRRI